MEMFRKILNSHDMLNGDLIINRKRVQLMVLENQG